ncbi:hypothetical protein BFP97_10305 [Roseivirga sp. 4D4]|uniref:M1 family metallopeptidase n=1 Tax=Roseivirga sp. 4D4 TaxID=1889784 RepID=UPI0008538A5A|nr:M1 family metallopeptidase [Roseivirga sp. 4D4]OEK01882.1 hypothetical protein BFP97_10305 [Roseivirga sp. 4D4]
MKLRLSILALFLSTSIFAQKHYERLEKIDVQHYQFELTLNDDNDQIEGKATITITFNKDIEEFMLDLINPKNGKGMNVKRVMSNDKRIPYTHFDNELTIKSEANKGDTKSFTITYEGVPETGLIISKNKYGDRTFFGDNWPNRGRHWLPTVDHPSDKATVEWIVTAPNHYNVVGNGRFVEKKAAGDNMTTTHWKTDVVIPVKVMVMGAARFAIDEVEEVDGAMVSSWVYPQDEKEGFYDYAQAAPILKWFVNNVAPYPYAKLANVQSKTQFGGMENAGNIFYSERSIDGKRSAEGLIAHEIAHQWFGNSASEANWHHAWLSEGFATYFTNLYMEQTYGRDRLVEMAKTQRENVISFSKQQFVPVVNRAVNDYMKLLNANTYQKGGWVLHMLRNEVGDEVFWKGIRTYYNKFKYSNALTEDLKQVFEEASGKDLGQFFKQWIYTPGQPEIEFNWTYKGKKVHILTAQDQAELFKFDLDFLIIFDDGSTQKETLSISDKYQSFKVKSKKRPAGIVLDPDTWLLFQGKVTEK